MMASLKLDKKWLSRGWIWTRAAGEWWLSELAGMIPEKFRRKLFPAPDLTVIGFEGDCAVVRRSDAHGAVEIHREFLADLEAPASLAPILSATALVTLPTDSAFMGHFKVPAAARAKLRQAVSFEVERRSPFRSGEALFDFVIGKTDGQTLHVEWATIPSALVDKGRVVAENLGYSPVAIGIAEASSNLKYVFARNRVPLLFRFQRSSMTMLAALVFLLGVAIFALFGQSERVAAVDEELQSIKSDAGRAQNIKAAAEKMAMAMDGIAALMKEAKMLDILREVTTALPDDSWVVEFDLKGDQLRLVGYSAAASSLIEHFAAVPFFAHPHFYAPITLQGGRNLERFDIAMTIPSLSASGKAQ